MSSETKMEKIPMKKMNVEKKERKRNCVNIWRVALNTLGEIKY